MGLKSLGGFHLSFNQLDWRSSFEIYIEINTPYHSFFPIVNIAFPFCEPTTATTFPFTATVLYAAL